MSISQCSRCLRRRASRGGSRSDRIAFGADVHRQTEGHLELVSGGGTATARISMRPTAAARNPTYPRLDAIATVYVVVSGGKSSVASSLLSRRSNFEALRRNAVGLAEPARFLMRSSVLATCHHQQAHPTWSSETTVCLMETVFCKLVILGCSAIH